MGAAAAAAAAAPVAVVGAGISGAACARVLHDAGVPVRVLDRARVPGGRMASRRLPVPGGEGVRPVDTGAAYFTVSDPAFAAVVDAWRARGLAREWTQRLHVVSGAAADGARLDPGSTSTGPVRWAAPAGLRSLVADLVAGLDVVQQHEVEAVVAGPGAPRVEGAGRAGSAAAVVLAMPDPQAADLLPVDVAARLGVLGGWEWQPAVAVCAGWRQRWWPELDGAFVNDSPLLSFVADDGRRRGDGAAVLVAHAAPGLAAGHLEDPEAVVEPVLAELGLLLAGCAAPPPEWTYAHRWSLARSPKQHGRPFGYDAASRVGVCGDAWGPASKVEGAFLSGRALGLHLLERLAG
ncbi:NAD(P)/FAD-dependent oxidoreductase [Kineococcus xinjiangensis]|uniref:NAD(P)/FAD-dependent oxidoreductase n=1 Tax=Kineococcus xinjiangensis TaxID=512762 RepID=UPI000CEC3B2A|nr:FAD-dependent oxidoreductase [Kineococcus xinjiangensis]